MKKKIIQTTIIRNRNLHRLIRMRAALFIRNISKSRLQEAVRRMRALVPEAVIRVQVQKAVIRIRVQRAAIRVPALRNIIIVPVLQAATTAAAIRTEPMEMVLIRTPAIRTAASRIQGIRAEAGNMGASRVEATKVEASRAEATKVEASRVEATRVEATRVAIRMEHTRQPEPEARTQATVRAISADTATISPIRAAISMEAVTTARQPQAASTRR